MYSKTARRSPARVGQERVSIGSRLMVGKKFSATAVSQPPPARSTESTTPLARAKLAVIRLVYLITPAGVDRPLGRAALDEGHIERVGDELGAHVVGQRPAHHPAGGQVDNGGQVGPAPQLAILVMSPT